MTLVIKPSTSASALWRDVNCTCCGKRQYSRVHVQDVLDRSQEWTCFKCGEKFEIHILADEDRDKALEAIKAWHTLQGVVAKVNRLEEVLGCKGIVRHEV